MVQAPVETTCSSGEKGSHIDYLGGAQHQYESGMVSAWQILLDKFLGVLRALCAVQHFRVPCATSPRHRFLLVGHVDPIGVWRSRCPRCGARSVLVLLSTLLCCFSSVGSARPVFAISRPWPPLLRRQMGRPHAPMSLI